MKSLLAAVRRALRGGRFITAWSLLATLPLSLTVMAPFGAGADQPRAWPATLATWLCFLAALISVALVERRLRGPRRRAVAVVLGLLLCSAARPIMQDLWSSASGLPTPPAWHLPFRVATNVCVWAVVFGVAAVLEGSFRALRRSNALLHSVASELASAEARSRAFDQRAERMVRTGSSRLRAAIRGLDVEGATAEDVRRLGSTGFRTWSHRLHALASEPDARPAPLATEGSVVPGRTRLRGLPYRVPARGVVLLAYGATMLPYALRSQNPSQLLAGIPALAMALAIDAASRSRALAHRPGARSVVFLAMSAGLGVILSALANACGTPAPLAPVPAVVYLAYAILAGLCAGALHAQRREQRRLSAAVRRSQRTAREGTRSTREGLRHAAELLHRDGQGACTVFVLAHPDPSRSDIVGLQRILDTAVSRMTAAMSTPSTSDASGMELTALFHTWGRVIDLRVDESEKARLARCSTPWVARDVYDLVAEGLLNTAKHGARRRADVSLDVISTGAGPRLRARVRSFGPLAADARLRPSSRLRDLDARLVPTADGAVLEASFALSQAAVVSPEHPVGRD